MIGQVIGSYRIVCELGRGGMGIVYGAEHTQLGKPAALKMLLPQLSADPAIVQRFFNEARAASAIDHPCIVEVYDFGTHTDGRAYLVMEMLKGESLEVRLKRAPMTAIEGATIVAQIAGGLAAAHARGIVHRDLKPDNIFLVPNDLVAGGLQVKLLDFGIAKLAGDQGGAMKTQTGALIGTPAYMSPEQCMGRSDLDHRTDLYSVGCVLYHILCGRPPFVSNQGTGMILAAHMRDPAEDPRALSPGVPPPLAAITMRLLEKDPAARFQTANELRTALVEAGAAAPPTRPPAAIGYAATMAPVSGYGATAAPTTNSGSAAQLVSPPVGARRRTGLWISIAAVVAVAGAIAAVVIVGGRDETRDEVAAGPAAPTAAPLAPSTPPPPAPLTPPASTTPPPPSTTPPAPAASPSTASSPPTSSSPNEPCAEHLVRGDETKGHCCWPDQVWSTSHARCLGKPSCPGGMIARGEACVVAPAIASSEHFSVSPRTVAGGQAVTLRFPAPLVAKHGERYWAALVQVGKPDSEWGVWSYVPAGARTIALKAPTAAGDYEVRLHGNYPTKSYNIVHRVTVHVE